jgi:hypothetical protein
MPYPTDNPLDGRGAPAAPAAHTPGPWLYAQNAAQQKIGGQWEIGLSPGSEIGMTGVSGCRGKDFMLVSGICREADARLIAAAPTMLATLRLALPELREDLESLVECNLPAARAWSANLPLPADMDPEAASMAGTKKAAHDAIVAAIALAEGRAA